MAQPPQASAFTSTIHVCPLQCFAPQRPAVHRIRWSRPDTACRAAVDVAEGVASTSGRGERAQPEWTGDALLSKLVNAAINTKPLYAIMKVAAKQVYKSTAERNGVPWDATVKQLQATPQVFALKEELEDNTLQYPDYYLKAFHAYEEGNLNWLAAFEVESATLSMALRTFPDAGLDAQQAQARLRQGIHGAIQDFSARHSARSVRDALDVGCSAGTSTQYLAEAFPAAEITGLDLSPHFLAVAEHRERQVRRDGQRRIRYMHADMEATGLPAESFDLVTASFVIHECPPWAIQGLIREARRLLRPGGVLMLADNNPRSKTIQNLPPALFTLMKSTEPWSDLYYAMDIEAAMCELGFAHVETQEADHRHRAVLGMAC